MASVPYPPSFIPQVPAPAATPRVLVGVLVVAIWFGCWPAVAQTDAHNPPSSHKLKWLPYPSAPAEVDRAESQPVETKRNAEPASKKLPLVTSDPLSDPSGDGPTSAVAPAVFQQPIGEKSQPFCRGNHRRHAALGDSLWESILPFPLNCFCCTGRCPDSNEPRRTTGCRKQRLWHAAFRKSIWEHISTIPRHATWRPGQLPDSGP